MTFLHTADWQLGKPFAGIADPQKRSLLQAERLAAVRRLGALARARHARFVLVAGDLFDSPTVTRATVSAACHAIGEIALPTLVIPGNHDHGGPGSIWEQPFFLRERNELAPNLRVLLTPEPVELDDAVLLPCPLLRRHEPTDPTAWLRNPERLAQLPRNKPRIVVAHGSTLDFTESEDDSPNRIDLALLEPGAFDYIALGDWHGTRQAGPNAWYPGTPEPDRFTKGSGHDPGNALVVHLEPGQPAAVEKVPTGGITWHSLALRLEGSQALAELGSLMEPIASRAGRDVVQLRLEGALGIADAAALDSRLESWRARLVDLRLERLDRITPSPDELEALTRRPDDPLIAQVASRLAALSNTPDPAEAALARVALLELHAACTHPTPAAA